jgi:hypothetical protein
MAWREATAERDAAAPAREEDTEVSAAPARPPSNAPEGEGVEVPEKREVEEEAAWRFSTAAFTSA